MGSDAPLNLHASCVAWEDRAALILGPSGSGKSALALSLMAYGCALVADDRTLVWRAGDRLQARPHPTLQGRIEARGVGILTARWAAAALVLAVDLGQPEPARLPPSRQLPLLGVMLPLLHNPGTGHFPAAILQYLKGNA